MLKSDIYPPNYIQSYLNKYQFNSYSLNCNNKNKYNSIIVIPAISELNNIIKLIDSLENNSGESNKSVLIIFVVNNIVDSNISIIEENKKTLTFLSEYSNNTTKKLHVAYIDASTNGNALPIKDGGVGLARKIGMDAALQWFNYNQNNLLVCLDADCVVETNYFETIEKFRKNGLNAGYIPFRHNYSPTEEERLAIACYEIFLNYYVAALKYSKSPFAFHSIGSTMVCSPEYYVKVQGMNKRKAAEDFYFMEKLAKITKIEVLKGTFVYPQGRTSWRVPFGTGQRVARYLTHEMNEYILYDSKIFDILKLWNELFFNENEYNSNFYLNKANEIDVKLYEFLKISKFEDVWEKVIKNKNTPEQLFKQKKYFFDGFRTLKLVHFLRDNGYPNKDMYVVLEEFFAKININGHNFNSKAYDNLEFQTEILNSLNEYNEK